MILFRQDELTSSQIRENIGFLREKEEHPPFLVHGEYKLIEEAGRIETEPSSERVWRLTDAGWRIGEERLFRGDEYPVNYETRIEGFENELGSIRDEVAELHEELTDIRNDTEQAYTRIDDTHEYYWEDIVDMIEDRR